METIPFYHLYYGKGLGSKVACSPRSSSRTVPWAYRLGQITCIGCQYRKTVSTIGKTGSTSSALSNTTRQRFDTKRIGFTHPDGIVYEFIGVPIEGEQTWPGSPVPAQASIQGIHSVEVSAKEVEQFDMFLGTAMGLTAAGQDGAESRYSIAADAPGNLVEVVHTPELPQGSWGYERNTTDHVAFNVGNSDAQQSFKAHLESMGFIDASRTQGIEIISARFISVHRPVLCSKPAGPTKAGFLKDETAEEIGTSLQLRRGRPERHDEIMAQLPPIAV